MFCPVVHAAWQPCKLHCREHLTRVSQWNAITWEAHGGDDDAMRKKVIHTDDRQSAPGCECLIKIEPSNWPDWPRFWMCLRCQGANRVCQAHLINLRQLLTFRFIDSPTTEHGEKKTQLQMLPELYTNLLIHLEWSRNTIAVRSWFAVVATSGFGGYKVAFVATCL